MKATTQSIHAPITESESKTLRAYVLSQVTTASLAAETPEARLSRVRDEVVLVERGFLCRLPVKRQTKGEPTHYTTPEGCALILCEEGI